MKRSRASSLRMCAASRPVAGRPGSGCERAQPRKTEAIINFQQDATEETEWWTFLNYSLFAPFSPVQNNPTKGTPMTRNGKIARLPLAIRQQLNQRLQDGQKARQLVAWLNGLPEVQAVLSTEFSGKPIAACNLTRWKKGGYQGWEKEQDARAAAVEMIEGSSALQELVKNGLSSHIAAILTASLIVELRRLDSVREGVRKSRKQRDLLDRFVALRNGDLENERLRIEQKKINFHRLKIQTEIEKQNFAITDTNRTPTPPG
jgi:bacterioferritin (cytochrome b1)